MIAELVYDMNVLNEGNWYGTHQRMLFPEPATKSAREQRTVGATRQVRPSRTFTMDEQKGTVRFPFLKHVTLCKPRRTSTVVIPPSNVVIFGWVRRREPTSDILLQLLAYKSRPD
jgi:hypothetical protein